MSVLRTIISNTLWRSTSEIIERSASAIFWIYVARYLGADGLGSIAFALSLFSLFETVTSLGLGAVVTRDLAKNKNLAASYFGQSLLIGLFLSLLFIVAMIFIGELLQPNDVTRKGVWIIAGGLIPASGFYWSRAVLWSTEKLRYVTVARSAENFFKVIVGLMLLLLGRGVLEIIGLIAGVKIISFAICFYYAKKVVKTPVWRIEGHFVRYLLKQAPTFSLIAVFNALFWSITVIILTKLKGEAEAGIFSAAFKLVGILVSFALAYGQALFPVASKFSSARSEVYDYVLRKSVKYISILTLAIAAGTTMLSDQIIQFIYDQELFQAASVLKILIWFLVPYALVPVFAYTLVSHDLQYRDLWANFLGASLVATLNFALIPLYGALGAAMALVLGTIVFFAVEYVSVHRHLFPMLIKAEHLKPLLGVGLMSAIIFAIRELNLIFIVTVSAVFYMLYLWITRCITTFEIKVIRRLRSA